MGYGYGSSDAATKSDIDGLRGRIDNTRYDLERSIRSGLSDVREALRDKADTDTTEYLEGEIDSLRAWATELSNELDANKDRTATLTSALQETLATVRYMAYTHGSDLLGVDERLSKIEELLKTIAPESEE